jgi:ABC-2 type transport system permease protein
MNRIAAFLARDVHLGLSYPSTLYKPFATIVVTVAGFAFLSRIVSTHARLDAGSSHIDYFTYVIVNLAFMLLLNAALVAVPAALRRDQVAGTLEPIVAAPSSIATTLAGSAAWPILFACVQVAAYLACAAAFGANLNHVNVAMLLQFVLLGCACTGALGGLAAAAVIAFKQVPPLSAITGTAGTLLGGVLFPISLLPAPLRLLSWMLPLTHALRGLRAAVVGASASAVAGDALWLAVASAVLLPAALLALRLAIDYVKTDGSLSAY